MSHPVKTTHRVPRIPSFRHGFQASVKVGTIPSSSFTTSLIAGRFSAAADSALRSRFFRLLGSAPKELFRACGSELGRGWNQTKSSTGMWSKCLLPTMAETRVHMGLLHILYFWHTQLVNEGNMDQTSIGAKL